MCVKSEKYNLGKHAATSEEEKKLLKEKYIW